MRIRFCSRYLQLVRLKFFERNFRCENVRKRRVNPGICLPKKKRENSNINYYYQY